MRRSRPVNLPAPYLKRVALVPEKVGDWAAYPFCLPMFREREFEIAFTHPVTVIVGENGVGKSTLLEGIAVKAGFGHFGGATGHRLGSHDDEATLSDALALSWLPRITRGYFFRAETFFSLVRYMVEAAKEPLSGPPPDWLEMSHGEGFLAFFRERCAGQGVYFFDEPESALSPSRQIEFMKILRAMERSGRCQVVIATHAPLLMAYPGADLRMLTRAGLFPARIEDTDHFRVLREFFLDPELFVDSMLDE